MAGPPHQAGISRLVRLDREPPSEELYADGSYEGPAQNHGYRRGPERAWAARITCAFLSSSARVEPRSQFD